MKAFVSTIDIRPHSSRGHDYNGVSIIGKSSEATLTKVTLT